MDAETPASVPNATGSARRRTTTQEGAIEYVVPRRAERVRVEQVASDDGDSGLVETLPDGSVSIPVFEERLIIQKKLVVRERIIVRKFTVTEEHRIEADLRQERVEIDADPEVMSRVHEEPVSPPPAVKQAARAAKKKPTPSRSSPAKKDAPPPKKGAPAAKAPRRRA